MGGWGVGIRDAKSRCSAARGPGLFPRPSAVQARRAYIRLTRYDGPISFRQATDHFRVLTLRLMVRLMRAVVSQNLIRTQGEARVRRAGLVSWLRSEVSAPA
jgi:hypothetical protein